MKKFLLGAVMIAAMMGVVMSSFKKEDSAQMKDGVAQTEQSMSPSEQRIIDFPADFEAMKQGAKAEGEAMTPENACKHLEVVFNYCYGFTQDQLIDMRMDTVRVTMPKTDIEGNICYNDLLTTYGNIVAAARETYKGIDLVGKTLKFVTMTIDDEGAKDGDEIIIVMNTGGDGDGLDPEGPFEVGECYIWGSLDEYETTTSAAGKVKGAINSYDASKMLDYNPCASCYTYIDNIHTDTIYYGFMENNDSLFNATGLTLEEVLNYQLCYDDLNREYFFTVKRGHWGLPTNLYDQDWYYYTIVSSKGKQTAPDGLYNIWHVVKILHCTRHWRNDGNEYPVPIDNDD